MMNYRITKLRNDNQYVAMVSETNMHTRKSITWLYTKADMEALNTVNTEPFTVELTNADRTWFEGMMQPLQTASTPMVANTVERVAIVGSRDYPNMQDVRDYVRTLPPHTVVVSGGARGVDKVAELESIACGLDVDIYPADWKTYGKSAGFRRNADIVANADRVVAFHHANSKGTAHTIGLARKQGKQVDVNPTVGQIDDGTFDKFARQFKKVG